MAIDSHQHFWTYDPVEYDWIDEPMRAIRRDFLPEHLHAEMHANGISGAINVQARQSLVETDWILELADAHPFILGVIGWLPLAADNVSKLLDNYAQRPKFKGARHVVQAEPDGFLDQPAFNRGVAALGKRNLVYEILIVERQLPEAIRFVDRHPNQRFVLDHIAKPQIAANQLDPWRESIQELARRENVSCKLSGMVTEADYRSWSVEQLRPYFETVLEAFGPKRLLFGSDWPVCLVASSYRRWVETVQEFTAPLSPEERRLIWEDNARNLYRIGPSAPVSKKS